MKYGKAAPRSKNTHHEPFMFLTVASLTLNTLCGCSVYIPVKHAIQHILVTNLKPLETIMQYSFIDNVLSNLGPETIAMLGNPAAREWAYEEVIYRNIVCEGVRRRFENSQGLPLFIHVLSISRFGFLLGVRTNSYSQGSPLFRRCLCVCVFFFSCRNAVHFRTHRG